MRPPLLSGPGHYSHSLDPGPSCILQSLGRQGTARERSWRGSRELSQCPVFALWGQAVVVHPSLLSLNVLVPAFNGRKALFAPFPGFELPLFISFCLLTLCTLLPPATPSMATLGGGLCPGGWQRVLNPSTSSEAHGAGTAGWGHFNHQ